MQRPAGVILTSIVQVLGSLFVLLLAAFMAIAPRIVPQSPNTPKAPPGLFLALAVVYLLFAMLGLATAIGIFRVKQWARYSTLIFAGFLVFVGVTAALASALVPQPPPTAASAARLPANFAVIVKAFMALMWLGIAALGGWWLYYLNRQEIRLRFRGGVAEALAAPSRRPLSIVVLATLSLFAVPWALFGIWKPFPTLLLGIVLRGTAARLVYFVFLAAFLYMGVGLLRLSPPARVLAIWFYAFGWLNTAISWGLPGRDERYRQILAESASIWGMQLPPPQGLSIAVMMALGAAFGLLLSVVAIYFLIARRSAFEATAIHP